MLAGATGLILGVTLLRQSKIDDARRHYETALRLRPGYHDAQQNLKRLLAFIRAK